MFQILNIFSTNLLFLYFDFNIDFLDDSLFSILYHYYCEKNVKKSSENFKNDPVEFGDLFRIKRKQTYHVVERVHSCIQSILDYGSLWALISVESVCKNKISYTQFCRTFHGLQAYKDSCFPPPLLKNQIESLSYTSKRDSFLQLVLLIDWIKNQFQIRYPCVSWSTNEESEWSGKGRQIEHHDTLTFQKQYVIIWCAKIDNNQELVMNITVKINNTTAIQLPLGVWKQYEQEKIKEEILKTFELELKNLIDMLYINKIK
jgi:hypothetical protein